MDRGARRPGFRAELDALLRDYVGRPSPLYRARAAVRGRRAPGLPQARGPHHTGAHKINNALGQALLARRMGKPRIIAETGAGQHGVATATACALLGPRVRGLHGHRGHAPPEAQRASGWGCWARRVEPVEAGARTLKEAVSAAIRDWVANVGDTHYIIGSARRPGAVPGARARPAAGDRRRGPRADARAAGRLPDAGDRLRRRRLERDRDLRARSSATPRWSSIGVEAGGEGIETGRHGAPLTVGGRGGVLHGAYSAMMQDEDGQILEAHSISAGLDYPGIGPEHAWLRDWAGRATSRSPTPRRWRRSSARARSRGSSPRWRARTRSPGRSAGRRGGRTARTHRPRLPLGPRRQGPGRGAARRSSAARDGDRDRRGSRASPRRSRRAPGRAALMPYLMGGFPDLETSRAIGVAYADGGADLVELGVPFSDPLADGPVIHAAGTPRCRRRDPAGVLERRRARRAAGPGGAHVLREPDPRPRRRALRRRAAGAASAA